MNGTGITRSSRPQKPYLWRGQRDLLELNARARADRAANPNAYATDGQIRAFSWPMPLPGPLHPSGNAKPKAAEA